MQADRLLTAARTWFTYPPGQNRATGYLNVCFQAYADGAATCDWHADAMDQTIISLGAARQFGLGDKIILVGHGDIIDVPAGTPHCILPDPTVRDERISIVFRGAL